MCILQGQYVYTCAMVCYITSGKDTQEMHPLYGIPIVHPEVFHERSIFCFVFLKVIYIECVS